MDVDLTHQLTPLAGATDDSSGQPAGAVQVLLKAGSILDALAEHGSLRPGEIAERTGEPRSSVYRLLSTLRELGFVESGAARGTVRLGLKLLRLGDAVAEAFDEREAALPAMYALAEQTGESVFLCVRRNYEAACIERVGGERVQIFELKLGGSLPLHAGAAPRVLLAYQSESFLESYLRDVPFKRWTDKSLQNARELRAALARIRTNGYAISDEDVTPGIAAVSAPIFRHDKNIAASLSLSGTRPSILDDAPKSIDMVTRYSAEISESLGHVHPLR